MLTPALGVARAGTGAGHRGRAGIRVVRAGIRVVGGTSTVSGSRRIIPNSRFTRRGPQATRRLERSMCSEACACGLGASGERRAVSGERCAVRREG